MYSLCGGDIIFERALRPLGRGQVYGVGQRRGEVVVVVAAALSRRGGPLLEHRLLLTEGLDLQLLLQVCA